MKRNRTLFALTLAAIILASGCKLTTGRDIEEIIKDRYFDNDGMVNMGDDENAQYYVKGIGEFEAAQVSSLEIDWLNDTVVVKAWDGDKVAISETSNTLLNDTTTMYHYLDRKGNLHINFMKPKTKNSSLPNKQLLVLVPRTLRLDEVEVNGVSLTIRIDSIACDDMELNNVSGNVTMNECRVGSLELNTVVSSFFTAYFSQIPEEIELNSVGATTELYVPEDAGMTIEMSGLSSNFKCELPKAKKYNMYVVGDGACHIECNGVSSRLFIHKK